MKYKHSVKGKQAPREGCTEKNLQEVGVGLAANGLIFPIVRPATSGKPDDYVGLFTLVMFCT